MDYRQTDELSIENLCVDFDTPEGIVHAVRDVSLKVHKGRITALVGESGSGKSVTSLAVMSLLARNGSINNGKIICNGTDLLALSVKERHALNGRTFGMIFQDPGAALDPLFTVEQQMTEGLREHQRISRQEARELSIRYLKAVNLQEPESLLKKRPFELSGGMCQRVMIAMTMALQPDYLIADEPTTALDVTVQKQILRQIYQLCREQEIGILFITHDLGVVAEIADEVAIMQAGQIVENGDVLQIFEHPQHAYTKQLLNAVL
ncbi:MAG: ABC transporter ATP-binding protein [Blautia sp.]|nr:ABC transporter ATP-binding protein [Blautia sp.]